MTGTLTNKTKLSIIVPVLNEKKHLPEFLKHLRLHADGKPEILVVDGGSTDGSWDYLQTWNDGQVLQTSKGRAIQMNAGAQVATGQLLYFVHVDSRLPKSYDTLIFKAIKDGFKSGCFRLKFEPENWLLARAAAGSRYNHLLCRGGDQSLFVLKSVFDALGGFDQRFKVCEDINFIRKLYEKGSFKVLPHSLTTSSRRFSNNGTLRLLTHFGIMHLLHWWGAGPNFLKWYYGNHVK